MLSPGEAAVIAPWIVGLAGVVALQFDAVPFPSSSTVDVAAAACPAPSSANAAARAAPVRSLLMGVPPVGERHPSWRIELSPIRSGPGASRQPGAWGEVQTATPSISNHTRFRLLR